MEYDNRTKLERMQDWAKEKASKYHLAPEPVANKWRLEREERELQKDDQLSYAWEASPNGMKWRMENPGANLSDYENAKGAHYADIRSEQLHSEWKRSPEEQQQQQHGRDGTDNQTGKRKEKRSKPKDRDFDMEM